MCCSCDTFYIVSVHIQCNAFIYTHRQKLSNSKLVLIIKKFRTKILEIQVLLSSFDFIRIEYQCIWTNVLRNECSSGYILKRVVLFHCISLTFRKGVYFKSYFALLWVVGRQPIRIYGESQRGYVSRKRTHLVKYRSNIWHNLFNKKHVKTA